MNEKNKIPQNNMRLNLEASQHSSSQPMSRLDKIQMMSNKLMAMNLVEPF